MGINRLVIDSSESITELCLLGKATGTDKSPYNTVAHRHPYTSVYTMLFAPLKNKPIVFGEIGVAMGASALLWRIYFRNAEIYMFDRDQALLDHAAQRCKPIHTRLMDVGVDGGVSSALDGIQFDVLIDDSSHDFNHQIRIIKEAHPFLKPGAMLIIEDVFRNRDEADYEAHLKEMKDVFSTAYFVVCEHKDKWSPGWDNDKMLVLVKH